MKLHLFTATYPTGFGESYLNYELPVLVKEFDDITLYPLELRPEVQKGFREDIPVVFEQDRLANFKLRFSDRIFILRVLLIEFIHCPKKLFFLRKLRRFYAMTKKALLLSKWIKQRNFSAGDIYYSFWMNEWAFALALLKKKGAIRNFVFRVNGYDIYDERHEGNYMPFRYFIYSQALRVIPLSKTAADDIKALDIFPEKIQHSYFGTPDVGLADQPDPDYFVIFSCSAAIELKRLEKIAEVVCLLDFPVKWVHHGDGPTIENVKQLLQKKAPASLQFVHSRSKEDIHELLAYEKSLCPDLFINLSTTEDLPVTIMEALSLGCTILVNKVGSCAEFVTGLTGKMVDKDASPGEIAEVIKQLKDSGQTRSRRQDIRGYWKSEFSMEKNYTSFALGLKQLFR